MIEEAVAHICTGFTKVVAGLHKSAIHTPSILDFSKYLILFIVLPGIAVIAYDGSFPIFEGVNLYLVLIISTPIFLLTPALLFVIFRFTGGRWLLNWHLKKTSRYLDFCRLPEEYKKLLLPKDTVKWHYQLAGSSADGFGFFPLLSSNPGIFPWSNNSFIQDVDINLFYKPLQINIDNLVPTSPGFCNVIINRYTKDAFLEDCLVKCGSQNLLSGKLITQKIGRDLAEGNVEYNYPAITFKTELKGPRAKFRFDSDVVFGIKIQDDAEIANWFLRVENIFPYRLLASIRAAGYYLVHKPCSLSHPSHDCDWRITFAEAESKLLNYHANKAALKLCYVVLKFAIKQFSKVYKQSYPALKSYHLKTVILWIAEEHEQVPFDMVNINNNKSLGALLLYTIAKYREHVHDGYLKHYFIQNVNILEPYSVAERTAGIQLLDEFKMKPLSIVSNFEGANLNRWKFDQFRIVGILVANASICFSVYFNSVGELFVEQIYVVCAVFGLIMVVKILLD